MYVMKNCSEIPDSLIFKTFQDGFADYMVQIEMDLEFFKDHFLGIEGNRKDLSFIAFKEGIPVGIVLGGFKTSEKYRTLRCGGMSVIPSERGTGIAAQLMKQHEKLAVEHGCRQLFLEVIRGNDRAIEFYKKMGYEKIYDLTYRYIQTDEYNPVEKYGDIDLEIEEITFNELRMMRLMDNSHLPWQGEFDYFKQLPCRYFGIRKDGNLIAGSAAWVHRLFYIWVDPEHRMKGYGGAIINRNIKELKPDIFRITYANNSNLYTFSEHLKIRRDKISQFELYKWLDKE